MQVKKDAILENILVAATRSFRDEGFKNTSIARVAKEAGISTGNVYRYFKSKDELFEAVLPKEFATEFRAKLCEATRITFGQRQITYDDPSLKSYWAIIENLLITSSENQDKLLILLARADGTGFESFRSEVVDLLTEQALKYAKSVDPSFRNTSDMRYLVREIYSSFLIVVTDILRDSKSPAETKRRLTLWRSYHLSGLRALFQGGHL